MISTGTRNSRSGPAEVPTFVYSVFSVELTS
jgi:hypothetical protein